MRFGLAFHVPLRRSVKVCLRHFRLATRACHTGFLCFFATSSRSQVPQSVCSAASTSWVQRVWYFRRERLFDRVRTNSTFQFRVLFCRSCARVAPSLSSLPAGPAVPSRASWLCCFPLLKSCVWCACSPVLFGLVAASIAARRKVCHLLLHPLAQIFFGDVLFRKCTFIVSLTIRPKKRKL